MTGAPDGGADADLADPLSGARTDTAPILAVDGFTGPLDVLLDSARAQKIDISKLSIAALIEAFVRAMDRALADRTGDRAREGGDRAREGGDRAREGGGQLGHWAAWTVMAATLTELWSRLKLPSDAPAARAAAAEVEALRRHLLTRAAMGVAADWLDQRAQLGQDAFRRGLPEVSVTGRGGDLTELLRACLVALHVPDEHMAAARPRPPPLWTASDALRRLARLLPGLPDSSPLWAVLPPIAHDAPARTLRCRAAVASTLIAALEQARDGALALDQAADWMPIRITRRVPAGSATGDPAPLARERILRLLAAAPEGASLEQFRPDPAGVSENEARE
jgi:segregation and condensation protein A